MESGKSPTGSGPRTWLKRNDRVPSDPLRLADLPPTVRRRAIFRCGATVVLCWVFLIGAFYVLPIGHESGLRAGVRVSADVALVGAVFAWQIRRISVAELPELRAVEALGIVVVVFLVLFSGIYLAMSHDAPKTFTQTLDHIQALYFTISIFSTVGFGDITPRTDTARLLVSIQMLLDLVIIGAAVRLIFSAARSRIAPASTVGATPPEGQR
jgi:voltage-gated potassium channel